MSCLKTTLSFRLGNIDDITFIQHLENLPENTSFIGKESYDTHKASMENPDCRYWIAEKIENPKVPKNQQTRKIGFIILKGWQNPHHSLELYRIAISEKNKGYGQQFLHFIQTITFQECKFHRLWLDVVRTNVLAISVYEKSGFKKEGC